MPRGRHPRAGCGRIRTSPALRRARTRRVCVTSCARSPKPWAGERAAGVITFTQHAEQPPHLGQGSCGLCPRWPRGRAAPRSTSVSMTWWPTPACTAITDIEWATTSCSSRAIRSRSVVTAARSRSSRSRSSIMVRSSIAAQRARRWRTLAPASHATVAASRVAAQSAGRATPGGWAASATRKAAMVAPYAVTLAFRVPWRVMAEEQHEHADAGVRRVVQQRESDERAERQGQGDPRRSPMDRIGEGETGRE